MRLLLAPMEGLLDHVLRAVLAQAADYDHAVSEFVRVTDALLPARAFRRIVPELDRPGCTTGAMPVRAQLLGSDPACLADNAGRLAALGAAGVDLNFGCPAPVVNRHRGGAILLDEPELLHAIARAVRAAVPAGVPFTAKMRLGVGDKGRAVECAQALEAGGVDALVVHARTRDEGYRPPAHWEWVARVDAAVAIPVAANGEVWSAADWLACRRVSGVADVMLGRGAVADPFLAARVRAGELGLPDEDRRAAEWRALQPLVADFWRRVRANCAPRHAPGRLKQWLNLLRRNYPQAEQLFRAVRPLTEPAAVERALAAAGIGGAPLAQAA